MVRRLVDAVRYAHDRRLVHRALSPRAIVVEPGEAGWLQPRVRIGNWQAAARGLSAVLEQQWSGQQILVLDGLTPLGRGGGSLVNRRSDHE